MTAWGGMVRELGRSVVDLLRLELTALSGDLRRSGRAAADGLALALLAFAFFFWTVGTLAAVVVLVLAIWLPAWSAALILLLLLALTTLYLLLRARRRLREVENPLRTVGRHVDDHLAWWQVQLAAMAPGEPAASMASGEAAPAGTTRPPGVSPGGDGESRS